MKAVRRAVLVGLVLLLTYAFTRLWLNSSWSEFVWSQINQWIEGGRNPGLASDIELVASLVCALVLAIFVVLVALKISEGARRRGAS